jgi:putative tricarboxylic transport membrane protein
MTMTPATTRISAFGGLLLGAFVLPVGAFAQEKFPSKPIEFILPAPPGGGLDRSSRLLADAAEPILGQKIIFNHKPGGGGSIGTILISQARPDGYTIGAIWHSPLTTLPHTQTVPYTVDSFKPVIQYSAGHYVMCVAPGFPAATGVEFINELKANPSKYVYGHDGVGNAVQLATERTLRALGVQIRGVPFNGSIETARAFLGGHIGIYSGSVPPISAHVSAGKAKCLLVHSAESNPMLPDATNLTELGIGDRETMLWHGVIAPKDVDDAKIAIIANALREAAKSPRYQEFIRQNGETTPLRTGAEFGSVIVSESKAMLELANSLGVGKK